MCHEQYLDVVMKIQNFSVSRNPLKNYKKEST